jgi:hypothetical protein
MHREILDMIYCPSQMSLLDQDSSSNAPDHSLLDNLRTVREFTIL